MSILTTLRYHLTVPGEVPSAALATTAMFDLSSAALATTAMVDLSSG